jgi:methyl-accepting chemotaxis protein
MQDQRGAVGGEDDTTSLKQRVLVPSASVIGLVALCLALYAVAGGAHLWLIVVLLGAIGIVVASVVSALRGGHQLASQILVYGLFGVVCLPLLLGQPLLMAYVYAYGTLLLLGALLLSPRRVVALAGVAAATLLISSVVIGVQQGLLTSSLASTAPAALFLLLIGGFVFLMSQAAGRTSRSLARRVHSNEDLNREVLIVASRLGAATGEIHAMMQQQTEAAVNQSSAVEQTRQVLRSVSESSQDIVGASQSALSNAETTYSNSERVAGHIEVLSSHTQDIVDILESIQEIADKSDLLALNAALEGTRAGEVGRGFSLVANQMQRLAESIALSVGEVQELTDNIQRSTDATQLSMEEAMKLARATIEAAQQINLVIQQQQSGVAQVTTAMEDIVDLTARVAAGTSQTIASTSDLQELAEKLMDLVKSYRERS